MSTSLTWRYSTPRDKRLRESFVCTDPPRASTTGRHRRHPALYELDTQSYLKAHVLQRNERMLLGFDGESLAACVTWAAIGHPSAVLLQAIGVAMPYRRQGGAVARETLDTAINEMAAAARGADAPDLTVEARIDVDNAPSQRLFSAYGFENIKMYNKKLEQWVFLAGL